MSIFSSVSFRPFLTSRYRFPVAAMDDSFFPAELVKEFELAAAEYAFADVEMKIDTAVSSESESTDVENEVAVNSSVREEDETEEREVDKFISEGCHCSVGPGGSACSKSFSREDISTTRMSCKEMSSTE